MRVQVNIVLVSDHGMTYGSNPIPAYHPPSFPLSSVDVQKVDLGSALQPVRNDVAMVVGSGAYSMVYTRSDRYVDSTVDVLKRSVPGIDVYTKDEIPDHLHLKARSILHTNSFYSNLEENILSLYIKEPTFKSKYV